MIFILLNRLFSSPRVDQGKKNEDMTKQDKRCCTSDEKKREKNQEDNNIYLIDISFSLLDGLSSPPTLFSIFLFVFSDPLFIDDASIISSSCLSLIEFVRQEVLFHSHVCVPIIYLNHKIILVLRSSTGHQMFSFFVQDLSLSFFFFLICWWLCWW